LQRQLNAREQNRVRREQKQFTGLDTTHGWHIGIIIVQSDFVTRRF